MNPREFPLALPWSGKLLLEESDVKELPVLPSADVGRISNDALVATPVIVVEVDDVLFIWEEKLPVAASLLVFESLESCDWLVNSIAELVESILPILLTMPVQSRHLSPISSRAAALADVPGVVETSVETPKVLLIVIPADDREPELLL